MKKSKFIASLADLNQQSTGKIPVEIIKRWVLSQKSKDLQDEILYPYRKKGYFVCTDSAGLSKISGSKGILETMKIVSRPKEIIYAHGKEIGGKGIGVWAADNSQMFYDENVPADRLLEQMAAAQKKIEMESELKVGMGIQKGNFIELGGAVLGHDAEIIEEITENHSKGGEILITDRVKESLSEKYLNSLQYTLEDLEWRVYRFDYAAKEFFVNVSTQEKYPIPFSSGFFDLIKGEPDFSRESELLKPFLFNKTVLLVKVFHSKKKFFLDSLTDLMVMKNLISEKVAEFNLKEIKSNGDLGIFVADDAGEAIDAAENLLEMIAEGGDIVSLGVASGDVLLFRLDGNADFQQNSMLENSLEEWEISGNPVNIASKISEDIDDHNCIYIHESVNSGLRVMSDYVPFSLVKSGVEIRGVKKSI